MRLKPELTAWISGVAVDSSSTLASRSPSRTRLTAMDSCCRGLLIRRAIRAAPASDSAATVDSQTNQVWPAVRLKRARSVRSQ